MIQEVAFGTRKLKFDSGEVKEPPRAILTCKYSHAIRVAILTCEKSGYEQVIIMANLT